MTSLTTAPVAALLARLFSEADASEAALHAEFDSLPREQQAALMTSTTEYQTLYSRLKEYPLAVSRDGGKLLYMLVRATKARSIVEFGASFAISTIHLAAAVRDNGAGRIITTEFEPSKIARAKVNLAAAGFADLVELREGDALETLARDLPAQIDFALLDGAKGLYPKILALLEPRLAPGALVLADNADWSKDYLAKVRDPASGYMSAPLSAEVELSVRL